MHKNAYTSVIDELCKMGVEINRDALFKRVEREIKNMTPEEVMVRNTITDLSSHTQGNAHHSSSAESDLNSMSATSSTSRGRPNGSTNEKKQNDKEKYDTRVESICDDCAAALDSNKNSSIVAKRISLMH